MLSAQIHSDFLTLPLELIFKTIDELPLQALLSLANTCQDVNHLTRDPYFWRKRIQAISPETVVLEPTKDNFKARLKRLYSEVDFIGKHFAKILILSAARSEAQQQLKRYFERINTLMHFPWGEDCAKNLSEVNHLLNVINRIVVELQLPPATPKSLKLEHITRLSEQSVRENQAIFSQLERLELNGNLLETLPENIDVCANLFMLDLYDTAITFFPKNLKNLTQLQFFYCSGGNTPELPEAIHTFSGLKWLAYDNMHLTTISEDINKLKKVSWLYLANNQISVLPSSLAKMKELHELFLANNPLCAAQPQKIIVFLQTISCDMKSQFKTQFDLLKDLLKEKLDDISALSDQFDLLSVNPKFTPQHSVERCALNGSLDSVRLNCHKKVNGSLFFRM